MVSSERYIVLVGDCFYPAGWDDFSAAFDNYDAALSYAKGAVGKDELRWYEVVDLSTLKSIATGNGEKDRD